MKAHQFCYETFFRLYKAAKKVKTEDDGGDRAHLHNATILLLVTVHDNQLYSIAKGDILLQICIIPLCRGGDGGGGQRLLWHISNTKYSCKVVSEIF